MNSFGDIASAWEGDLFDASGTSTHGGEVLVVNGVVRLVTGDSIESGVTDPASWAFARFPLFGGGLPNRLHSVAVTERYDADTFDVLFIAVADREFRAEDVGVRMVIRDDITDTVCSADVNADGSVGVDDLMVALSEFGAAGFSDFDASGRVDINDLVFVLGAFGTVCP